LGSAMSRVYFGNLDPLVTQQDLERECNHFGRTASVWVARSPPGFAFVEFEDSRDAEDCVRGLNDKRIGDQRVRAEIARNKGKNAGPGGGGFGPRPPGGVSGRGTKHRAILKNLPPSYSWKELKDEMRRIGGVIYADVDNRGDGSGVVEFATAEDLEAAVSKLDGSKLDGNTVTVYKENLDADSGGGRGDDRREEPRRDEYRDDRRDDDRRDDRRDFPRDDRRDDDHRRREDDFRRRDDDVRYREYDRDPPRDDRRRDDDFRREPDRDERPRGRGADRHDY